MQGKMFSVESYVPAKFAKYVLAMCLVIFSLSAMSFTIDNDKLGNNKTKKDSTTVDPKAFKSLFTGGEYDPAKPYLFQLNPKAVSFVEDYISKQGEELENMRKWGKPYFDMYDRILTENGVPKEMKYLSVIESHLSSKLVSWAGAVGPWQLMPDEARRFHLKTGKYGDERTDFVKSTEVASKLLRELYDQFDDWLLVVAAYNGGAGRVRQAIKKANSKNFWDLQYYLPQETRNHVKKFIATHYLFEGGGGWTTMTADETAAQKQRIAMLNGVTNLTTDEIAETTTIAISGRYNAGIITKSLFIDVALFNKYNPAFEKTLAEGKTYQLRIPNDKVALFQSKKQQILQESVQLLLAPPSMPGSTTAKG